MQATQWITTLILAGALGTAMAADADAANKQTPQQAAAQIKPASAELGSAGDECPVHGNKQAAEHKECLEKNGERCPYPHDKMHMHHAQHMSKHEAMHGAKHEMCDPAKEAAKPLKPSTGAMSAR